MDDYTLEKLTVKPAKLSPTFNSKVFEYSTTVSTNVAKVTVDCLTNDTGASYQIKGNKGLKVVELAEGRVTEIDIEVSTEDGTVGHYVIKVKRLSGKDASLSALSVDKGHLSPEFDSQHDEYWDTITVMNISCVICWCLVSVPIVETEVLVTATPPDAKCQLSVGGKAAGEKTTLNIGDTLIEVTVGSIDGTVTKTYKLYVTRPAIPRFIKISDPKLKLKFEDPFSLAPFYQPISIRESDPRNTFSAPIITELTRTNKYDPISQLPLPSDWIVKEFQLDKELSDTVAVVPLSYGGSTEGCPIRELPANLSQTNVTPKHVEVGAECTSLSIKHTYELRPWEKNLQQIFDESNPMKLMTRSKDSVKYYLAALPATPGSNHRWPENQHPLDHISHAAQCLATAIKAKKTDANSHLQLGLVLEERYLAEDMFSLKSSVGDGAGELATLNVQVKAGSKEEEIAAICKIHGVDEKAPLSLVLKALDTEYQAMKNAGNTAKAEQVQSLFAWKNKQATQEGAAAQKAAEDTNSLGQAYLKYLDALSCDETKSIYHFHVGRLQVVQGLYDEAVTRLQSALSWNKQHQMARFYLGLALSLRTGGPQARAAEAFAYIQEAIELLLAKQTNLALAPETGEKQMLVEDLLRLSNVHILRGIISLGKMIQSNPEMAKNCMSAEDLYHTAALLSTTALPTIARGDLYKQMEWVVLDAHSLLLDIMLARADDPQHVVKRCQGLSAFIRCATIGENPQLAALQLKTSKALVSIQPSSSQALYLLGVAQLAMFDLDPKGEGAESLLEDCKRSLRASIEMEGKSTHSDLPSDLKEQVWWKEKQSSSTKESTKEEPSSAPATRGAPSRGRGTTAGRGTAAPRGSPAARGAAAKAAPVKPAANQKSQQIASHKDGYVTTEENEV
ncbi:hypothetical protein EB796_019780 [Bugula neritina]|uniref:Cadherin-like beta-sandwich-like domain-containing protein n=1 Tax=Bugula neritina TaxID=10212 RepID=A0A7J7J6Z5_BUGNE|nr:hypothetical protein EB796_019780 [Bugula neritina]